MTLKDVKLKISYVTLETDVVEEFYKPAISNSKEYKRISGYFSSNFLKNLSEEIDMANIKNNIKIKILCSPQMSEKDIEDIRLGYSIRNKMTEKIIDTINTFSNDDEVLPLLTKLIIQKIIDIRFVLVRNGEGIFHDKKGIFIDKDENRIAFKGSNNETFAAISKNYESFVTFTSWETQRYVEVIEKEFENVWLRKNKHLEVLSVNKIIEDTLKDKYNSFTHKEKDLNNNYYSKIDTSLKYELYGYQKDAINSWKENEYHGLLEMATGTGKTITALSCYQEMTTLFKKMVTVITVPQKDLSYQWQEDIISAGTEAIICSSDNSIWEKQVNIKLRKLNNMEDGYLTIITVTDTFIMERFQDLINKYKDIPKFLISDEVHGFGSNSARRLYSSLENSFPYRLGISATPFRKNKKESEKLINFFGGIVYSYNLKDAIANGYLNKYEYIPHILYFNDDELIQYRNGVKKNLEKIKKNDAIAIKEIEILTSRIANSSTAKVAKLVELMNSKKNVPQSIIYCSPGDYNDGTNQYDERHIDYVSKLLSEENKQIKLRKIRSGVSGEDRQKIVKEFKNSELNTLLAIKCLDQGINLPNVTDAYILSSTDSPTEFIQRRGRILRISKNKPVSKIYDLVMLPQKLENPNFMPDESDLFLISRELRRMKEYNSVSENFNENLEVIEYIENKYSSILLEG